MSIPTTFFSPILTPRAKKKCNAHFHTSSLHLHNKYMQTCYITHVWKSLQCILRTYKNYCWSEIMIWSEWEGQQRSQFMTDSHSFDSLRWLVDDNHQKRERTASELYLRVVVFVQSRECKELMHNAVIHI